MPIFLNKPLKINVVFISFFVVSIIAFGCKAATEESDSLKDKTLVGAIRWDAWTGGEITKQVEKTLGPEKYHSRLPWFAKVVNANEVVIDGSPQEVMDQEIKLAAASGLDYWAILIYPGANVMSVALKQYLKSAEKNRLKFCMILSNTMNSKEADWIYERDRIIELIMDPLYLKVLTDRPLIYVFNADQIIKNHMDRITELRAIFKRKGLDPYWVYMGWNPATDWKVASEAGFDAVSCYACGGQQKTFPAFASGVESAYWYPAEKAGAKQIPLVSSGWDKRPRIDHPVSWEPVTSGSYHKQTEWAPAPTPAELGEHLKKGINFVRNYPLSCESEALLIYAWNEYDEGGWIAPTLQKDGSPDRGRLEAISNIIHIEKE
jgi:hypothetical protein